MDLLSSKKSEQESWDAKGKSITNMELIDDTRSSRGHYTTTATPSPQSGTHVLRYPYQVDETVKPRD